MDDPRKTVGPWQPFDDKAKPEDATHLDPAKLPKDWSFKMMGWSVVVTVVVTCLALSVGAAALAIKVIRWAVE